MRRSGKSNRSSLCRTTFRCKKGPAEAGPHVPHKLDLEIQLHRQLHDARIARRVNGVERRRGVGGRSAADRVGVIKSIESLQPELPAENLGEFYVLE